MRYQAFTSVLIVTLLAGCIPAPAPAPKTPAPPSTPEPAAAAPADSTPAATAPISATPDAAATEAAAPPPAVEPPAVERVAAEAGVGKKGQSLKNDTGIVVEPVKQLIRFEQKAVFGISIKQALELYKGEHGFYPKTHEEFMDKVIKFNNISLPELPAGQRYIYDPEQAQLMVEKPKQ